MSVVNVKQRNKTNELQQTLLLPFSPSQLPSYLMSSVKNQSEMVLKF